jgi:hypothetical protein
MKTIKLTTITALLFCIITIGCKETHCPAFPKPIADTYFPYTENDTLNYSNTHGDTLSFEVNYYHVSNSYSFGRKNDVCLVNASFQAKSTLSLLKMTGDIYLEDNAIFFSIYFYDGISGGSFRFSIDGINPYVLENIRLHGDTINMTNLKIDDRFTTLQLIAEKGITRFFDKEQDCEWVLVENSLERR